MKVAVDLWSNIAMIEGVGGGGGLNLTSFVIPPKDLDTLRC